MEKVLQSDQLAAVLSVDKEHLLEPVASPQPFRLQPRLTVVIDYEEYKDFLNIIPADWGYLYRLPPVAAEKDTLKCFYMDMLRAVLNELFYASAISRQAGITVYPTRIRHRFEGVPVASIPLSCVKKEPVVRSLSENIGCVNIKAQSYTTEWAYACALCELVQSNPIPIINYN